MFLAALLSRQHVKLHFTKSTFRVLPGSPKTLHKAQLPFKAIPNETEAGGQLTFLAEADHGQLS